MFFFLFNLFLLLLLFFVFLLLLLQLSHIFPVALPCPSHPHPTTICFKSATNERTKVIRKFTRDLKCDYFNGRQPSPKESVTEKKIFEVDLSSISEQSKRLQIFPYSLNAKFSEKINYLRRCLNLTRFYEPQHPLSFSHSNA